MNRIPLASSCSHYSTNPNLLKLKIIIIIIGWALELYGRVVPVLPPAW
jgi:hypothetical protein